MKGFFFLTLAAMLVFGTAGCAESQAVRVTDAWARPGNTGSNSAIYFLIENNTGQDDILMTASASVAQAAELHMSTMKDDGTMTMQHQDTVAVPRGDKVEFMPGGLHVMLINLSQDLKPGDTFPLKLTFQHTGELQLQVEVKEP